MLSHFRRRLAALAALAVLAALVPTVTSTPTASAAPATTAITALTIGGSLARTATYKACPTGAASAAGFTDTTSTAVDCLKMYGITKGTTDTTYSPDDSVPRWAMALYITRAHAPAGGTLGAGADQGFTDISGKSDEIQLAINQIAELGITVGKTATTFAPDDNVTREEMAMFIERWLGKTLVGPGGTSDLEGALTAAQTTYVHSQGGVATASTAYTGLYNYTDIDSGSVTVEGSNAIKELYDLGIHDGVSATTYNPASDMTRAAMATFMELALNHTNARPAGLWLQSSAYTSSGTTNAAGWTPTLSVSDRSAAFAAVEGTAVDVHYWTYTATEGNAKYGSTGLCDNSNASGGSITKCYIDSGEPATNAKGNMVPTVGATVKTYGAGTTVIAGYDDYTAWTAASGTTYDNDLHGETAAADDHSNIIINATAAAVALSCTMDTPANTSVATSTDDHTMKFAATTTVTCQTKDGTGDAAGSVAKATQYLKYNHTRTFTDDSANLQDGAVILRNEVLTATDANGTSTFTITGPTDTTGTDVVTDNLLITSITISDIINGGTIYPLADTSGFMTESGSTLTFDLVYKDTAAAATTSTLTSTATSGTANAVTGITRTYTATQYDQYGDTVASSEGTFSSSSTLPGGASCTISATPSVCTTEAAHGLAVDDDLIILDLGSYTGSLGHGSTAAIANSALAGVTPTTGSAVTVYTVPSTTTFTVDIGGTPLGGTLATTGGAAAASSVADPTVFVASSVATATRSTTTDGTASFSWTDLEGTSGLDTISWNPTTGATSTKKFYRLAAAADFTSTDSSGGALAAGETSAKLVEWDGTNDDFILEIALATSDAANVINTYKQYTFDANDHFATTGTTSALNGSPVTQAAWELAMAAQSLVAGGTANDIVYIDYGTGISTDINRFTTD